MFKAFIFISFLSFVVSSCSNIKNPVVYTNVSLIPTDLAAEYLNSKKESGGKCNYFSNKMNSKEKNYRYVELYFNTYKFAGSFTIDVKTKDVDFICWYDFGSSESSFNKFADALSSLGVTYESGVY
tara:strand:- start:108 stop:485 length:378 start_codon:yes stop_codon:yes gene_type:complete